MEPVGVPGPARPRPCERRTAKDRELAGRTVRPWRPRAMPDPPPDGKKAGYEGAAPGRSTAATHLGDRRRAGSDLRRGCEQGDRAGPVTDLSLTPGERRTGRTWRADFGPVAPTGIGDRSRWTRTVDLGVVVSLGGGQRWRWHTAGRGAAAAHEATSTSIATAPSSLRCQEGDGAAFAELYTQYHDRLHRFCMRRLCDRDEAEEIAQEAFLRAWRALPTFSGGLRFYPWLTVIAEEPLHRRAPPAGPLRHRRGHRPSVGPTRWLDAFSTAMSSEETVMAASTASSPPRPWAGCRDRHRHVLRSARGARALLPGDREPRGRRGQHGRDPALAGPPGPEARVRGAVGGPGPRGRLLVGAVRRLGERAARWRRRPARRASERINAGAGAGRPPVSSPCALASVAAAVPGALSPRPLGRSPHPAASAAADHPASGRSARRRTGRPRRPRRPRRWDATPGTPTPAATVSAGSDGSPTGPPRPRPPRLVGHRSASQLPSASPARSPPPSTVGRASQVGSGPAPVTSNQRPCAHHIPPTAAGPRCRPDSTAARRTALPTTGRAEGLLGDS